VRSTDVYHRIPVHKLNTSVDRAVDRSPVGFLTESLGFSVNPQTHTSVDRTVDRPVDRAVDRRVDNTDMHGIFGHFVKYKINTFGTPKIMKLWGMSCLVL
jgi:hypothetical protein